MAKTRSQLAAAEARIARLTAALTRYLDTTDLTHGAYVEKYGVTTYADALDLFVQDARVALLVPATQASP